MGKAIDDLVIHLATKGENRSPMALARELLEYAKTASDPGPLIEAAQALLSEAEGLEGGDDSGSGRSSGVVA